MRESSCAPTTRTGTRLAKRIDEAVAGQGAPGRWLIRVTRPSN